MLVVNMQYQANILVVSGFEVDGDEVISGGEQLAPELDFFEDGTEVGVDFFDDGSSFVE